MTVITQVEALDVRFPTSRELDGSDAMNPDPDYSAAYAVLHTDTPGLEGHGFTFTIGRGTEVCVAAIRAYAPFLEGRELDGITGDLGGFWRLLAGDSQLRWLGPEKGVVHLALAAVVNAVWDLYAKVEGQPVWRLLAGMSPRQVVDLVDWRYLTDALTPDEALDLLARQAGQRTDRLAEVQTRGIPAYTTSAGWLGYDDDKLRRLCREAKAAGWTHVKLKVGGDVEDDVRRCAIAREELGEGIRLMVDANQRWDVEQAIGWMGRLAPYDPWWIEEPTSPDDVLGHAAIARAIAPVKVATGEHVQNRVVWKQLLQAGATSFVQLDACRLGGVNEVVAVLLLAAKFGLPVCPHAGGVGLCELVQHISAFDMVAVGGPQPDRVVEYVDHLHEHFVDPVQMRGSAYLAPERPGYSAEIRRESLERYRFPDGAAWR